MWAVGSCQVHTCGRVCLCYSPFMADRKTLTEREWVGTAIKNARTSKGLKQRELVELTQAAGLPWTQGILANVEIGSRDVSLVELLLVCVCLGTTPAELLYPEEEFIEYVELPSGNRWSTHALGELLDNNPLTGDLAAAWSFGHGEKNLIEPDDVLEIASKYLADPDAVEIAQQTGLELEVVSARVSKVARTLIKNAYRTSKKRQRWTAKELVDMLQEDAILKMKNEGKKPTEYAERSLRVGIVRAVAQEIAQVEGEK